MICPTCQGSLRQLQYEGIAIESCAGCGGHWLDADELGKIVRIRQVKFDPDAQRAIAEATTITGVVLAEVDRDLLCPRCGSQTDSINYGGDTGILLDRCTGCRGFWLDAEELEKVQMLVERWQDGLEDDLQKYRAMLRDVEVRLDAADDVTVSQLPFVARFINAAVNGILDVID